MNFKHIKLFENFNKDIDITSQEFINSVKEASSEVESAYKNRDLIEKQFIPFFHKIIDSNNIKLIQEILNFFPKKHYIYSLSFLYQQIYIIKEKMKKSIKFKIDKTIDIENIKNEITKILPLFEEASLMLDNAEDKLEKLIDIMLETDDISKLRIFNGYISDYSSLKSKYYEGLTKLSKSKN